MSPTNGKRASTAKKFVKKITSSEAYEVECIIGESVSAGERVFRVKWAGYPPSYNTWEPEGNLTGCTKAVEKWRKNNPSPGPSKRRAEGSVRREQKKSRMTRAVDPSAPVHPDRTAFLEKLKGIAGPPVTLFNDVDDDPSPPLAFEFISELKVSDAIPPFDPSFICGCTCEDGCADPQLCQCVEDLHPRVFAYNKKGLVERDNRLSIIECNKLCNCGEGCSNRVVQNGRKIPLEIFKTEKKGWGLRCPIALKKGTFVDIYLGEVIDHEEAERRTKETKQSSYLFDLDKFWEIDSDYDMTEEELVAHPVKPEREDFYTVDGRHCGGVTRFINHSCSPNLSAYAVASGRRDGQIYNLGLFTRQSIKAYEELTFSYDGDVLQSKKYKEEDSKWPCYCGAKSCVGFVW